MKHAALIPFLAVLIATPQAFAQPPISVSRSQPTAHEVPTPDSVVWKSFYDTLLRHPVTETQDFLVSRIGLTSEEAAIVVTAAQQYLAQFSSIDAATSAEIKARYQPANLPANLPQMAQNAGLTAPPPSALIGGRMADGRTVHEAIVADGIPARVERQRDSALQAHHLQLRQTIGPQKFTALQDWVNSNVAPTIKSFDVVRPPVPATVTTRPVLPSPK
jgi:hypothetical protein